MLRNSCPVILQTGTGPKHVCHICWCQVTSVACVCDIGIHFGEFGIGKVNTVDDLKLNQIKPGARCTVMQSPSHCHLKLCQVLLPNLDFIKRYIFKVGNQGVHVLDKAFLICGNENWVKYRVRWNIGKRGTIWFNKVMDLKVSEKVRIQKVKFYTHFTETSKDIVYIEVP